MDWIKSRGKRCWNLWKAGSPPVWLVVCGAITVQIGFGLYLVIVKKFGAKERANPYIFTLYRDSGAFPVLLIYSLLVERKPPCPNLKIILLFMLLGLCGMFGGQVCSYMNKTYVLIYGTQLFLFITALYTVGPDATGAFQPLLPIWMVALAPLTCTEKRPSPIMLHTWTKIIGILLAAVRRIWELERLGGAIQMTLTGITDENSACTPSNLSNISNCSGTDATTEYSPLPFSVGNIGSQVVGYIALFGETFLTATYVLLQKKFIFAKDNCKWRDYPIAVTAYSYFFGAIYMGLACIYFAATGRANEFLIPKETIVALLYAVFIVSALCYSLLTWSNKHLKPSIVTAFWPTQGLVAVIGAFLVTGDQLLPWQYAGALLIVIGLMFVLLSTHMDERQRNGQRVIRLDDVCCKKASRNLVSDGEGEEEGELLVTGLDDQEHNGLEMDNLMSSTEQDKSVISQQH